MNRAELVAVGSWIIIPVIGFVYVRVMGALMRRAGVPPIEEQVGALRTEERRAVEKIALRKAA